MSHTVEVCLKYEGSLKTLKGDVEQVLGIHFTHYESGSPTLRAFYSKVLSFDVELSTHVLDTDRELNYSDFQYVLGTRVAGHACAQRLLEMQAPLTDLIGALLSHHLNVEVMVTVDVQELLARYQPT